MNAYSVSRRSSGLSYGGVYSGPIGAIVNPTFDLKKIQRAAVCFDDER
jgi:L-lactate dehydrogenase complex protein LldF